MKQILALIITIASLASALAQPAIQITNPQDGSSVQGGVLLPFWVEAQSPIPPGVMLVEQFINGKLVNDYFFVQENFWSDVFVTHYWKTKGQGPFLLEACVTDWAGVVACADPVTVFRQ